MAAGGSMVTLAKGNRSRAVTNACKKYGGFYLGSIGGPAAILAQDCIKKAGTCACVCACRENFQWWGHYAAALTFTTWQAGEKSLKVLKGERRMEVQLRSAAAAARELAVTIRSHWGTKLLPIHLGAGGGP